MPESRLPETETSPEAPAGAPTAPGGARNLILVVAVTMAAQIATAIMALTPPVVAVAAAASFGVAAQDIGFFAATLFAAAMVSSAAGGDLIARFGAVRVTQGCMVSATCGLLLVTTASVPLALLGAVLIGFGYGPATPASSHLLAPVASPRWRALLFSVKQTAVPIGGAITGLATPALLRVMDWQAALWVLASSGLLVALVIQPVRAAYDADRARGAPLRLNILGAVRMPLADAALRRVVFMAFAFSATQLCFTTYFVTFLVDRLGFSLVESGAAYATALIASVGFRIMWGALAGGRVPGLRLLSVLSACMALVCGLTIAVAPGWPLWALYLVGIAFASCAVSWNGVLLAAIVEASSVERSGAATGGVAVFIFAGMMAGPAAFGLLVSLGLDYGVAYALVGAVALLAGLPGFFASGRR